MRRLTALAAGALLCCGCASQLPFKNGERNYVYLDPGGAIRAETVLSGLR